VAVGCSRNVFIGWSGASSRALAVIRHWALLITAQGNPSRFAEAIRARGLNWRAVIVQPARATAAVKAIQPALIVLDSTLPNYDALSQAVQRQAPGMVISDSELTSDPLG
jgi:hypothetical protein